MDSASVGSPGNLLAIKLVMPAVTLHVTRLEVFTGEVTGVSTLDLRSHVAASDEPGALLGEGGFSIVPPNGWQGPDLPAAITLAPSSTIWLVWKIVNNAQATIESEAPTMPQEEKVMLTGSSVWNGPFTLYSFKLRLWCDGQHP